MDGNRVGPVATSLRYRVKPMLEHVYFNYGHAVAFPLSLFFDVVNCVMIRLRR